METFRNGFTMRFQLPEVMFIHPVISIAQIEPVFVSEKNPFRRKTVSPPPILAENDAEPEYKLKRVVNKRVNTKKKKTLKKIL